MPVTRGALKKLRQDKKRRQVNLRVQKTVKAAVKSFKRAPSQKLLSTVYSTLDSAGKKGVYHSNKVARLKSRLTNLLTNKAIKTVEKAPIKKPSRKKKTT